MRLKGVSQIVQFNWPTYAFALLAAVAALLVRPFLPDFLQPWLLFAVVCGLLSTLLSLIASWYVYDASNLYDFDYIETEDQGTAQRIANIHAGFDETTTPLSKRFPQAKFDVFDFYDPQKHTEASIRRARNRYPSEPGTIPISSDQILAADATYDRIFLVFAAHEIRDDRERIDFFKELRRISKPGASVHVVEHLRDWRNALVYSVGCLHFHSDTTWHRTFEKSGWPVSSSTHPNPFIISYHLKCSSI